MGDIFYPNSEPVTVGAFERHLYLYHFNGLNPYPRIETKFDSRGYDPVQGKNFLYKFLWIQCCEATQKV